jgi:hypothetical protein
MNAKDAQFLISWYAILMRSIWLSFWLWLFLYLLVPDILYCRHCMNFACPFNAVDDMMRIAFFEKNPGIKEAWGK